MPVRCANPDCPSAANTANDAVDVKTAPAPTASPATVKDESAPPTTATTTDSRATNDVVDGKPPPLPNASPATKYEKASPTTTSIAPTTTTTRVNVNDGQQKRSSGKLRRCGGCQQVFYCGVECQRADRPRHRSACAEREAVLASERARAQRYADALEPLVARYCLNTIGGWFSGMFKALTHQGHANLIGTPGSYEALIPGMEKYFNETEASIRSRQDPYVNAQFDGFKDALGGVFPCMLLPAVCELITRIVNRLINPSAAHHSFVASAKQGYKVYMAAVEQAFRDEWQRVGPKTVLEVAKQRDRCQTPNHHHPPDSGRKAFTLIASAKSS